MKQYLELLEAIQQRGTNKPAARENMPGTRSLFGYQFRHNLADGFPLLTTKRINFKNIVVELLWFLRGDTNIQFLLQNNCNIWSQDSFQFYNKQCDRNNIDIEERATFEQFVDFSKKGLDCEYILNYRYGDCGYQYGKVWRDLEKLIHRKAEGGTFSQDYWEFEKVDQIANLLKGLKETPEGRRHLLTAIDPAHENDLALYWCHVLCQFNCRPLTFEEKIQWMMKNRELNMENVAIIEAAFSENTPKFYLDCQMYQRSCDVVLGVPYNIASYALLTHILAKLLNMIPGEYIHTFGDVHIYDNHKEAVKEQLSRTPTELPTLNINTEFWNTENESCGEDILNIESFLKTLQETSFIKCLLEEDIQLNDYNPQFSIKAELSTGLKK